MTRSTSAALDELSAVLPEPIVSISVGAWPTNFPTDIAGQRRVPYESRADSVMYRQVMAEVAHAHGRTVNLDDAKGIEAMSRRATATEAALSD